MIAHLRGEVGIGDVDDLRREDGDPPAVEASYLVPEALRAVAVDATMTGFTVLPSAVRHVVSASMATSNSPTVVPSAPVMRCSSSWMTRSGGRNRGCGCTAAAGSEPFAGCLLPSLISQCG